MKASNANADDGFGLSVALANGTLLVGAPEEDSASGAQGDNSGASNGAAYAFTRSGTAWVQEAYLKASNTDRGDGFGASVAVNVNGQTLAVAAIYEDSAATGVGGNPLDDSVMGSGAVYLFAP